LKKSHAIDIRACNITRRIVWGHLKSFGGKISKAEKWIPDKLSEINTENRMKIKDQISQQNNSTNIREPRLVSLTLPGSFIEPCSLRLSFPFRSMQDFLSEKTFQETERVKKEVVLYFASKPVEGNYFDG
jgi:hypothetical protein